MRTYLKYCLAIITLSFALVSPLLLFIYSTGEALHIEDIVDKQLSSNKTLLYGTALHRNTEHYKNLMLDKIKPEILALGSSRVMQFRQHMFKNDFYNLGGLMVANHDVHNIIPKVKSIKPKVVILGVDFWWFHDNWEWNQEGYYKKHSMRYKQYSKPNLDLSNVKSIAKWIAKGEISIKDIYFHLTNPMNHHLGISGIYGDGFASDGSMYNTREAIGGRKADDVKFSRTIGEIVGNKDRGKFQYASTLNGERVQTFLQLIRGLEKQNIHVITFLPPLVTEVNNEILKLGNKFNYIDQLKHQLRNADINFYDFSNAELLEFSSCEFLDGYHGGEVVYMRILNEISKTDEQLEQMVNIKSITNKIYENQGRWIVPNPDISQNKEIDFLKIGCQK